MGNLRCMVYNSIGNIASYTYQPIYPWIQPCIIHIELNWRWLTSYSKVEKQDQFYEKLNCKTKYCVTTLFCF